jgi:hypothetical protein
MIRIFASPRDRIKEITSVTDTAIFHIVPYPDATINPWSDMCKWRSVVYCSRSGGTWSGPNKRKYFDPEIAGPGNNTICLKSRTLTIFRLWCGVITVYPIHDATIISDGICLWYDPPFNWFLVNGSVVSGPEWLESHSIRTCLPPGIIHYLHHHRCNGALTRSSIITVATPMNYQSGGSYALIIRPNFDCPWSGGVCQDPVVGDMFIRYLQVLGPYILVTIIVIPASVTRHCSNNCYAGPGYWFFKSGTRINGPPVMLQADPPGVSGRGWNNG